MAEATQVRIDGAVFPLVDGDDFTPGDLARVEAHYGMSADKLGELQAVSVIAVAWVSARRVKPDLTLADVERAQKIEILDADGNLVKNDEAPDPSELEPEAVDELEDRGDGSPVSRLEAAGTP